MTTVSRVDAFQRRHPVVGFPLAVTYKLFDDQGVYLAALITYYGFLSLFPLLLLLASVLGFVLDDDPQLQGRILDSTLSQFPVVGEQLRDPQGLQGNGAAAVIGAVIAIYGALGVAQALQNAMNVAWAIPRHHRRTQSKPAPAACSWWRRRGWRCWRRLPCRPSPERWAPATATSAVRRAWPSQSPRSSSTPSSSRPSSASPPPPVSRSAPLCRVLCLPRSCGNCSRSSARLTWTVSCETPALPTVSSPSCSGCCAWIFLAAMGVIVGVEVNVVRTKRLYPRALLTPFTDNVDLTTADRRSYTDAAVAQRHKGFEHDRRHIRRHDRRSGHRVGES